MSNRYIKIMIFTGLFSAVHFHLLLASSYKQEVDLCGKWRFEIGDNKAYADPDFDDSSWELIHVPNMWENEGYPGYDGYAWYRIRFYLPNSLKSKSLCLQLGFIDDIDETFMNGIHVGGEGEFPPSNETAYNMRRIYELNENVLQFGKENCIAVRVFDSQLGGGIVIGEVGIYSQHDMLKLKVDLSGEWKFRKGDSMNWAQPDWIDQKWETIKVPSYWEKQGHKYDGIAWYRKTITLSKSLSDSKLILMLGQIDNIDEVYVNGTLIGKTGIFPGENEVGITRGFRSAERAYFIPPNVIRFGKPNTIAVRVLDVHGAGGIYLGYVGFTTRKDYLKYTKNRK
ncbi:beta galactosidase jelly roll domain-containing protein [candidate division KSB1 bacterium]|nr:beta galactosidase jelly roll domain-containing protein [candidate division KSB1 bacterium]